MLEQTFIVESYLEERVSCAKNRKYEKSLWFRFSEVCLDGGKWFE